MGKRAKGRANGEGSIYEYPKSSGKWFAQITLDNGRPKRRRADSQKEARDKLRELRQELAQGVDLSVKQPTLEKWCAIWLDQFAPNLRPNIKQDYRDVVRRYIAPAAIGKRPLHQLTPAHIQAWVNDLARQVSQRTKRPLSALTIHNAHARLHKALAVAVTQGYVARNVASDVELPPLPPSEIFPLDFDQAAALLASVAEHRWYALYRLAINLGMREGELLGLTWEMIDFKAKTIKIAQQLKRVPGPEAAKVFTLQATKPNRVLVLTLDDDLIAVLKHHRAVQAEERLLLGSAWKDSWGLVFTSDTGAPIHTTNLMDHYERALKAAGISKITFHQLRHTAATLMLMDSVPLVTVSKILGHSSPAVTAKIYAHALDSSKAGAIASLSQKLQKAGAYA